MSLPPPEPLPQTLWGNQWTFTALTARDLTQGILQRPIPIKAAIASLQTLSPDCPVPGVVIEAGRRSLKLARWIQAQQPQSVQSVLAELNGLLLQTQEQRWILMTYDDAAMAAAARQFERQKQQAAGHHFLLIQPDDSGVTTAGVWVLQSH